MALFFQKYSTHLILSFLALSGLSIFHMTVDLPPRTDLIFITSDAQTYRDVAHWLMTGEVTESLSTRPLLYPLLMTFMLKIGGNAAIFWMQSIFWLMAVNFCFASLKCLTKNKAIAFLGSAILACNLSLMALTAHGLTEVTSVLLLIISVFVALKNRENFKQVSFGLKLLFMFVLLTLVKPVFYLPTLFLLIILLIFYRKQLLAVPKKTLVLLLILLPLLGQMALIHSKFDQFKVSTIGSRTLSRYFLAQGLQQIENLNYPDAVNRSERFSKSEQLNYITEHKQAYFSLFFKNIKENIKGAPIYLRYPELLKGQKSERFMIHFNHVTYMLHWISLFLGSVVLISFWRTRKFDLFVPLFFFFMLNAYLLLVTGISFWQGDRLTITNIAIWSVLYPFFLFYALNQVRKFKLNKARIN
jgi:hypothetical protein